MITRSEVTVGVLLVALVYIERAKPHLTIETMDWAHERVFLGALILASKVCQVYSHLSTIVLTAFSSTQTTLLYSISIGLS